MFHFLGQLLLRSCKLVLTAARENVGDDVLLLEQGGPCGLWNEETLCRSQVRFLYNLILTYSLFSVRRDVYYGVRFAMVQSPALRRRP